MRLSLVCHPDFPPSCVAGIEVEIVHGPERLSLRYVVAGEISALSLPPVTTSARADRLWEHSCFEAFLGGAKDYVELNFAASTLWGAYRFESYRSGMRVADIAPRRIETSSTAEQFELRAEVVLPGDATRLGLAAVIEERSGRKSYWALAHPPGAPDFHHDACFALELPAAEAP